MERHNNKPRHSSLPVTVIGYGLVNPSPTTPRSSPPFELFDYEPGPEGPGAKFVSPELSCANKVAHLDSPIKKDYVDLVKFNSTPTFGEFLQLVL